MGFNLQGDIHKLKIYSSPDNYEEISESLSYYNTTVNKTNSGLYIFNPLYSKIPLNFSDITLTLHTLGRNISIVQVYKQNSKDQVLKTYVNVNKPK